MDTTSLVSSMLTKNLKFQKHTLRCTKFGGLCILFNEC